MTDYYNSGGYYDSYSTQYAQTYQEPPNNRTRNILLGILFSILLVVSSVYTFLIVKLDTDKRDIEKANLDLDVRAQQERIDEIKNHIARFGQSANNSFCLLGDTNGDGRNECETMRDTAGDDCKKKYEEIAAVAANPGSFALTEKQQFVNRGLINEPCSILHHACPNVAVYTVKNDVALEECLLLCKDQCQAVTYIDKSNSCYIWSQKPTNTILVPNSTAKCYIKSD